MKTNDIAIKHGVPTPETSKELDWKEETNFYWYLNHEWILISLSELEMGRDYFEVFEMIPAPQMHEILSKMPNRIEKDGFMYYLYVSKLSAVYTTIETNLLFGIGIAISVTEHLAKLYIKLKKEGLL